MLFRYFLVLLEDIKRVIIINGEFSSELLPFFLFSYRWIRKCDAILVLNYFRQKSSNDDDDKLSVGVYIKLRV